MFKDDSISVLSEKILPEKIKTIIWHKDIDVIVITCNNYYEIHRVGYKHEVIFKKEEAVGIVEIIFVDQLIGVILKDSTFYYLNIATSEVVLKTKIPGYKGSLAFNRNANVMIQNLNSSQGACLLSDELLSNPFGKDLNFISFSKIDVQHIQFFQNCFGGGSHLSYVLNRDTKELDLLSMLLVPIARFKLTGSIMHLDKFSHDELVYVSNTDGLLTLHKLSLKTLIQDSSTLNLLYKLAYATHIIDYVRNILDIINKIIYKLGISFFDKYTFSNKLEHIISSENEEEYKSQFCRELKELLSLGTVNDNLKELFKDLFEGRSIIKMDENIYFNLKNIEDIMTDNIKPAINSVLFYIDQIKSVGVVEDVKALEDEYRSMYVKFELFFNMVVETKINFRNFLAWINMFNPQADGNGNNIDNLKNHLNNYVVDYKGLQRFIDSQGYNLKSLIVMMEKDDAHRSSDKSTLTINSSLLSNSLVNSYMKFNGLETLCLEALNNGNDESNTSDYSLKTRLLDIKDKLNTVKGKLSQHFSDKIETNQICSLSNVEVNVGKITVDSGSQTVILRLKNQANDYLLLFKLLPDVIQYTSIELAYQDSTVVDYEIEMGNLYILVMFKDKLSITKSKLSNYTYTELKDLQNLDVRGLTHQVIKNDSQVDIESSENPILSCGLRGLISVIENRKNKVTIIKL
jgi:hypothetical protein